MKHRSGILLLAMLMITLSAWGQQGSSGRVNDYIARYKDLAMEEQVRTGVPAAITLAQGICESGAGTSELAQKANNHFGIKCKHSWQGATYNYDDNHKAECFRKYENDLESYKDHSDFLRNNPRYASLFELKVTDYKKWAEGLKECGYATNRHYAKKLIGYIRDYNLEQYTKQALSGKLPSLHDTDESSSPKLLADNGDGNAVFATAASSQPPANDVPSAASVNEAEQQPITYYVTSRKNGLKGFYARKGDLLLEYAINHHIRYAKILNWNDLQDAPLAADMFIYLEKKRTRGLQPFFKVKPGMDLHQISQETGVELEQLRLLNHLNKEEEPQAGTLLSLQQPTSQKVKTTVVPTKGLNKKVSEENAAMVFSEDDRQEDAAYVYLHTNEEATKVQKEEEVSAASEVENLSGEEKSIKENGVDLEQDVRKEVAEPETKQKEMLIQNSETPGSTERASVTSSDGAKKDISAPPEKELTQTEKLRKMMDEIVYEGAPELQKKESEQTLQKVEETEPEEKTPPVAKEIKVTPTEKLRAYMETVDNRRNVHKEESYTTLPPGQSVQGEGQPGSATPSKVKFYTVQRGDTAYSIAKKFGISLKQLREWNNLPRSMTVALGVRMRVSQ